MSQKYKNRKSTIYDKITIGLTMVLLILIICVAILK
jgi:hypothetical protein